MRIGALAINISSLLFLLFLSSYLLTTYGSLQVFAWASCRRQREIKKSNLLHLQLITLQVGASLQLVLLLPLDVRIHEVESHLLATSGAPLCRSMSHGDHRRAGR